MRRLFFAPALVCLGLLFASGSSVEAAPADVTDDPVENVMLNVTNHLDDLLDTHINDLDEIGAILLALAIICRFVAAVPAMRGGDFEPILQVWVMAVLVSLIMTYYNTPLPGSDLSLHQVPSYVAQLISATFDMAVVDDFYDRFYDVLTLTEEPDVWNVSGMFIYLLVQAIMLTMDLVLFVINGWGFVGLGITTLFGKILIPGLMTKHFQMKFFSWLDLLVGFAMLRAVATAMSTLWGGIVIQFLDRTVNGDYTLVHWTLLAGALVLVSGGFIYGLLKVPWLAEKLFGGMGSAIEGWGRSVGAYVNQGVAKVAEAFA